MACRRDEFAEKEKKLREDSEASVSQLRDKILKVQGECEGKMSGVREEAAAACGKEVDSKVEEVCKARVEEVEKEAAADREKMGHEVAAASQSGAVCEGKLAVADGAVQACEAQQV